MTWSLCSQRYASENSGAHSGSLCLNHNISLFSISSLFGTVWAQKMFWFSITHCQWHLWTSRGKVFPFLKKEKGLVLRKRNNSQGTYRTYWSCSQFTKQYCSSVKEGVSELGEGADGKFVLIATVMFIQQARGKKVEGGGNSIISRTPIHTRLRLKIALPFSPLGGDRREYRMKCGSGK